MMGALRRAADCRSFQVALAVGSVLALGLSFSPLFGTPGVESALVFGIVLPPFMAAFGARYALRYADRTPIERAYDASLAALAILGGPVLLQLLATLWFRNCALLQGLAFLALGPGVGAVYAAVTGVLIAALVSHPRWATGLAVAAPLVLLGWGVWEFWSSPAIFVFGHYGGWFPGTLYDRGIELTASYLTFRVSTVVLVGLLLALLHVVERGEPGVGFPRWIRPTDAHVWAVLLAGAALAFYAFGPELGHRATVEHIAEGLGVTRESERCIVHAPREMDRRELRRLVQDCSYRVVAAEEALGVREHGKVRAFFFRTPEEKQKYMGARRTYIAKPWRGEVYLQQQAWPHPVLAHEVVHVVARNTARGPFQVGGSWGGWLPDPALIEGVAVAAAWDVRGGLTPHQWARAMVELDQMPSLNDVFGLSFLAQPPRNAYTVAGSFLRFLLDQYGADAVATAYRTGDLEEATGKGLTELESEWREFLDEVSLPPEAKALAEVRFRGESVLSAVCPHEVARLQTQLAGDLAAGDHAAATDTCEEILAIDDDAVAVRAQLLGTLAWKGNERAANEQLSRLTAEPPAPQAIVAVARERLANAAWHRGDAPQALSIYRSLLSEPLEEDRARSLEVRIDALAAGGRQADAVFDLLVGQDGRAPARDWRCTSPASFGCSEKTVSAPTSKPASSCSLSISRERCAWLTEARERGLATERLEREARRMEVRLAVGLGRTAEAERLLRAWSETQPPVPVAAEIEDWSRRIRWMRSRRPAP